MLLCRSVRWLRGLKKDPGDLLRVWVLGSPVTGFREAYFG
jgi:hypothetical protein